MSSLAKISSSSPATLFLPSFIVSSKSSSLIASSSLFLLRMPSTFLFLANRPSLPPFGVLTEESDPLSLRDPESLSQSLSSPELDPSTSSYSPWPRSMAKLLKDASFFCFRASFLSFASRISRALNSMAILYCSFLSLYNLTHVASGANA